MSFPRSHTYPRAHCLSMARRPMQQVMPHSPDGWQMRSAPRASNFGNFDFLEKFPSVVRNTSLPFCMWHHIPWMSHIWLTHFFAAGESNPTAAIFTRWEFPNSTASISSASFFVSSLSQTNLSQKVRSQIISGFNLGRCATPAVSRSSSNLSYRSDRTPLSHISDAPIFTTKHWFCTSRTIAPTCFPIVV